MDTIFELREDILGNQSLFMVINGKEWCVPQDEANSDYQQYLIDTDGGLPIHDTEPKV